MPGSIASTIPSRISPPPAWWAYGGSCARAPTPWQVGWEGWPGWPASAIRRRTRRSRAGSEAPSPGRATAAAHPLDLLRGFYGAALGEERRRVERAGERVEEGARVRRGLADHPVGGLRAE